MAHGVYSCAEFMLELITEWAETERRRRVNRLYVDYVRTWWAVVTALRSDDDVVDSDIAEHVFTADSNKHNLHTRTALSVFVKEVRVISALGR